MSQPLRRTLLIVCEGSVTEPNYFASIVSKEIQQELGYTIHIRPKPTLEELQDDVGQANKPAERKRRTVNAVEKEPPTNLIPEEFRAQPLSYVWQARNELGVMDEAWAVFDKDQHPQIEAAFNLAQQEVDGKVVNIAFSSISFETWILSHFEENYTAFAKTECRTRKIKHDCGQQKHEKDCNGEICVTGYIKVKGYVPPETDLKQVKFEGAFKDQLPVAVGNAIKLRRAHAHGQTPIWQSNPYTDIDKLVFKLVHLEADYKWYDLAYLLLENLSITFSRNADGLIVHFENKSAVTIIVNPGDYQIVDTSNLPLAHGVRLVISPAESKQWEFSNQEVDPDIPCFFSFLRNDGGRGIAEILQ